MDLQVTSESLISHLSSNQCGSISSMTLLQPVHSQQQTAAKGSTRCLTMAEVIEEASGPSPLQVISSVISLTG